MSPRTKAFFALFSAVFLIGAFFLFRGEEASAPIEIEDPSSPASPASEPRDLSAKPGSILVENGRHVRVLSREEGDSLLKALLDEERATIAVEEKGKTSELPREKGAALVASVLREKNAAVTVDERGAVRVRDAKRSVRVVVREEGESLGEALIREEKRSFASIESRSREVGTVDPEMDRLLAKPYEVQLASLGAPLAAIVPPDMKDFVPTPAPTPSFCPQGTSETWKKSKTSKERYCLKSDRGGVPYKQGPVVTHYPSGKKRTEGSYEAGRATGIWIEWHPNGRKGGEGAFQNGKRAGTWTYWWASGSLQSRGEYKDGLKSGKWIWYDDRGRKESEGVIRTADNLEHEQGTWTYFHSNGTKRAQGVMKNGRREGRWTEWSTEGRVVSVDDYRGGDLDS